MKAATLDFLLEFRRRLLYSVIAVVVVFIGMYFISNNLYQLLALPLIKQLPGEQHLVAIGVISPFIAPLKLALVVSIMLTAPFWLYQLWAFVAPALYKKERRLIWPLLFVSTILFYAGIAFAYWVVMPLALKFLVNTAPTAVTVTPDITHYLDFALKLFMAFGLAFEVPVATILVLKLGIVKREELAKKRPYIIVLAFILGMILTPPDVISQVMLAIPIWLLFELGLFLSRYF